MLFFLFFRAALFSSLCFPLSFFFAYFGFLVCYPGVVVLFFSLFENLASLSFFGFFTFTQLQYLFFTFSFFLLSVALPSICLIFGHYLRSVCFFILLCMLFFLFFRA